MRNSTTAISVNVVSSTVSDDEEIYHAERILSHRWRKGKLELYVKWKGFPDEDNTWEPERILFCEDLIIEYKARFNLDIIY